MAKTYTYSNKGVPGYNEERIKIPVSQAGGMSTETRHVFLVILNTAEFRTMDDSIQGNRLASAIDEAEGKDFIEIGEGVYTWLKKKAEQVCPNLFRVNGEIVYEFVKEGFEKSHQSQGTKEGKKD